MRALRLALIGMTAYCVATYGYRIALGFYYFDFAGYFALAHLGFVQGWSGFFDLPAQREAWRWVGPTPFYPDMYPPFVAWVVGPLLLLPYRVAYGVWLAAMTGLLVFTWYLLAPRGRFRRLHLLALFGLVPVAFGLWLGQVIPLEAAAVAACWLLLRRGRDTLAGIVLAALLVKPQVAFLVPVALVVAGRWRAVAGFAAAASLMVAIAVASIGVPGFVSYASRLHAAAMDPHPYLVAKATTLFDLAGSGWLGLMAMASALLLTLVAAWQWRGRGPEAPLAIGLIGSLLVTPFVHVQDSMFILVAAWLLGRSDHIPRRERMIFVVASWMAIQALLVSLRTGLYFEIVALPLLAAWPRLGQPLVARIERAVEAVRQRLVLASPAAGPGAPA